MRNWNCITRYIPLLSFASNRTYEELKYHFAYKVDWQLGLPIVPMRNWNILYAIHQALNLLFQSYLWGIEISIFRKAPVPALYFQSYLWGIEISADRGGHQLGQLPIVPMRNWNGLPKALPWCSRKLPIVPMRNWNSEPEQQQCWIKLFQSYLWGIEMIHGDPLSQKNHTSNRTYEELK